MAEKSLRLRIAPAKEPEHLHRILAAAESEDRVAVALADAAHGFLVAEPGLLERGEAVRAHHLAPLVAVVSGGVPAGEDVREGVEEAVLGKRRAGRKVVEHALLHVVRSAGEPALVQNHVDGGKRELHEHRIRRTVVLRGADALEEGVGNRRAGVHVAGKGADGLGVEAPILHELRRQLDRVPVYEVYAARANVVDARERVLQGVAELVEQRVHLAETHEHSPLGVRRGHVADDVHERKARNPAGADVARMDSVHPRSAAFHPRAGERVDVEMRQRTPALAYAEETHVLVPSRHVAGALLHRDAEKAVGEGEHSFQHLGETEILHQLLLGIGVKLLTLAFAPERTIPYLDLRPGKRSKRGLFFFPCGSGCRGKFVYHPMNSGGGRSALLGQREFRVILESQQLRLLLAQSEDAVDERRVVQLA